MHVTHHCCKCCKDPSVTLEGISSRNSSVQMTPVEAHWLGLELIRHAEQATEELQQLKKQEVKA